MGETIFVVDDEQAIADLVGLYLENENFTVRKFCCARDALARLRRRRRIWRCLT